MKYSDDIEHIEKNCGILVKGYREKVEYRVPVKYHTTPKCPPAGKTTCGCPVHNEHRSRNVSRPGLLEQLRDYAQHKDTDRNPKPARGAPRIKTAGRPPGDLGGFLALDELTVEIYVFIDRTLEEGGRDRTYASAPLADALQGLPYQIHQLEQAGHTALVTATRNATDRWVSLARAALNQTVADATLTDTVCGNCAGALTVAWDASGDVRCIGSPADPPCGMVYRKQDWILLLDQQQQKGAA